MNLHFLTRRRMARFSRCFGVVFGIAGFLCALSPNATFPGIMAADMPGFQQTIPPATGAIPQSADHNSGYDDTIYSGAIHQGSSVYEGYGERRSILDSVEGIWSGGYMGAIGSYRKYKVDTSIDNANTAKLDITHMAPGAYIGFNAQVDMWLLGVEGDFSYMPSFEDINLNAIADNHHIESDMLGHVRVRGGIALGDRIAVFAAGGVAIHHYTYTFLDGTGSGTPPIQTSQGHWLTGYTIGGGVEFALTKDIVLRGEYLFDYIDGKEKPLELEYADSTTGEQRSLIKEHIGRVGASMRF